MPMVHTIYSLNNVFNSIFFSTDMMKLCMQCKACRPMPNIKSFKLLPLYQSLAMKKKGIQKEIMNKAIL